MLKCDFKRTILTIILVLCTASLTFGYTARPYYGAMLEPLDTVYNGAGADFDGFNNYVNVMDAGEHPSVYMAYWGLHDLRADATLQEIEYFNQLNNEYLIVELGLYIVGMEDEIAAGLWDKEIENLCDALEQLGHPVLMMIGYESNYSGNNYEPNAYKQAFIRITNAVRARNLEVATVWSIIPAHPSQYMPYYPGDEYVDWWSINFYNNWAITNTYTSIFLADAHSRSKPVIIGESAPADNNTTNGQSSWDGWFIPYFLKIGMSPAIKGFCYVNWYWPDKMPELADWGDCRLEANEIVAQNFRSEMDSNLYQHAMDEQTFRSEVMQVADVIAPGKVTGLNADINDYPVTLNWNVTTDNHSINRYKVTRNGQVVGYSMDNTYSDSGSVFAGKTYNYDITAIDSGGNQGVTSNSIMVVLPPSFEKLINREFDLGRNGWTTGFYSAGLAMDYDIDTTSKLSGQNSAKLMITQTTGTDWHLQLAQKFQTKQNFSYEITFTAVADLNTTMVAYVYEKHLPYANFISQTVSLTTSPQTFTVSATAPDDDVVEIAFLVGAAGLCTIWIDDISITETSNVPDPQNCAEVYSRGLDHTSDFTGDCHTGFQDFVILAGYWFDTGCTVGANCDEVDLVNDDMINYLDLDEWASSWPTCNDPTDQNCTENWIQLP